ncbi:MAG TPA: efflux RND transporter permease subunit [Bryocella sp.]|nr:efflux RND transporter permease subunit [Bryocella sp.]
MPPPSQAQMNGTESDGGTFWLVRWHRTIFFAALVLTTVGVYAFYKTPIAVFPETNFPRVVIGVDNGVMPVEQMQVTITKPIEDAVNSVPGLQTVRSTTSRGSAEVSLFFDWSADMFQTLQLVNAALSRVQQSLPSTAKITTNRLTFATFPILGYSLTSDTLSQTQLWELATYTLQPPLNRVNGVSTVTIQGGKIPEFHVVPNIAKLQAAGVTILDLANAIGTANIIDSPGLYEENHQLVLALVGSQAHDIDDLRHLTVKSTNTGAPVRVSDVAEVIQAPVPAYTYVSANGKPAVLLNVTRQPSSNTVAVADAVAAEVAQLRTKLPSGVTIEPYYDQSELVRESIKSVRDAILIGLLLACVILYLFLRDWRSSLVAGLVIPVTVAVTVLALWVMGESFNLMTLGGLAAAIGLVIDDAIVVVENIALHREAGEGRIEAVRKALREIARPLVGSTTTPVVVFLPLIIVTGVTGSFFRALAVTMAASLLTSLLLAVTWTPGLALSLLRSSASAEQQSAHAAGSPHIPEKDEHAHGRILGRVMQWHHSALDWSLSRPIWLGVLCLLLLVGTFFAYKGLGSDLLPEMDEGGFILDYIMPAGSSLASTGKALDDVEAILRKTPEVESTSRRTGLQMGLAAVTEANTGDITVKLKQHRSRGIDEIMADIRKDIKQSEPGLDIELHQILQDNINDLSNAPEPIQIKLFTPNAALLSEIAPRVADEIKKVDGVVDVENGIDNTLTGPATNFEVDSQLAARMGFTPQEVAEDATAILDGVEVTTPVISNGRPYGVRIRLGDETRQSLETMRDTVFNSASGHTASLGSMTTITQLPPQNEIRREDLQRVAVVTANLEGTDLGTAVKKVQQTVQAMHLPANVRVEYGGTYQEQQKSFAELARVLLIALVLVFGVLLTEFRNFAAPTAILTSSVLSIAGVVGALLATATTFNVASFMGLIMVIGIVAKNGILLLDADERFRAEGMNAREAMVMAAQRRLRPILMTALAAVSGMLPLALALGAGSQMLQPLAIAVIGGLTISMLLSLVVTPVVYFLLTRHHAPDLATLPPQEHTVSL